MAFPANGSGGVLGLTTAPTTFTASGTSSGSPFVNQDGFDLVWRQIGLQKQMKKIEDDIRNIEENANLSDTERMFSMQMAMNTWSAISNVRTNQLKAVADTLKSIARNVE